MFTPVKLQTSCPGLARRPVLLVPVFLALRWIGGLGVPSYEIDVNAVPDEREQALIDAEMKVAT